MKSCIRIVMVLLCLVPTALYAQQERVKGLTLEAIETDRKHIVAVNMQLNELESGMFWPLYEEYQVALGKIEDRIVAVLQEYANHYDTLSDEKAEALLDDYFKVEARLLQLKMSYAKKFSQVLPMKRVLRYFQIENKIEAMTNYGLVRIIPLVK